MALAWRQSNTFRGGDDDFDRGDDADIDVGEDVHDSMGFVLQFVAIVIYCNWENYNKP